MSTPTMSFDERYGVILSRDPRFDGQFVTAVSSTGIYCRPSCPARTPKPSNVSFFATSAAAHEAGYRACKRCLPEAAPGSPEWDLRGDTTARAMRLIADGVVEREGVPGLARRLGYSPRHLTRLLTAELGAGPLALSRAHRAHTARMLLVGTDLPAADVAFSAGFSSIRQFNETVREVFGMPPLELRARRRRALGGSLESTDAPGAIDLVLPHRGPFDADGLFAWMGARAISGVESATPNSFARTLRLAGGPAWFELRLDEVGRIRLRARLTHLGDLSTLVTRARRLFDLDADPIAVDEALARHAELAPLVARVPGIRVPGAADPHEMLIRAMVGQQITVSAARTALTALADALGERVEIGPGPALESRLFPTMAAIAERGHEVLRGPAARTRAIVGAAEALADGTPVSRPRRRGGRPARRAAGHARHRTLDGRLRAHARDRRHRRLSARRCGGPHRCRRSRASGRGARPRAVGLPHRTVAQLPDRTPVARRAAATTARRLGRRIGRRPATTPVTRHHTRTTGPTTEH